MSTKSSEEIARLREANAALSRFAAQAAHDLQEPLRLMSGYLDILCYELDRGAASDAPRLAHEAKDAAVRMQRLVASLLDYTRTGEERVILEDVAVASALADAVANLRLRILETGASVTHGELPTIRADRGQLVRVLQNLVENSLKYRGARPPLVHVSAARSDGGWAICVDDDGPGFPRIGRERLFQPFARLDGGSAPGAGLGLATVRAIVERGGGTVEASDAPSGGARVRIWWRETDGS